MTQKDTQEIYLEPNKFARPAEIEIYTNHIVFHGYQEYILTKNALHVSEIDINLRNKQNILAPYFCPRYLAHRSVLDIGANAGFFSFWAVQKGAEKGIAIDMDEKYLNMMREAKQKLRFDNLEIENAKIMDWDKKADVVIALALVHWIYSCTALYGSLDATIMKLRQLTKYMLIVEWVAQEDYAIDFFHHIDWNKQIIKQEYNLKNFEAALSKYFARFESIGDISPTRRLYIAFCGLDEIDLSGPLPFIADKDYITSSKCVSKFEDIEYWSIIYDMGDKIIKQATLDLAERETRFISQLNCEYFPKITDTLSEETYSVITIEKIRGDKLLPSSQEIVSSVEMLLSFIQSCLDILCILEKKGIVHRDIRPDNILVRDSKPVLIDFGWAVSADLPYFTPARLGDSERPEDGSFSDIYSMGKIFKQINNGRYPMVDLVIDLMIESNPTLRISDIKTLEVCFDCIDKGI